MGAAAFLFTQISHCLGMDFLDRICYNDFIKIERI